MLLRRNVSIFVCCATLFLSFACAKMVFADEDDDDDDAFAEIQQVEVNDPLEKLNRKIFGFNEVIFNNVYIPFGKWYENHIPLPVRWSFKNFTQHYTETPQDMILSVLDFDLEGFLVASWRFLLNSTIGMWGILDPANDLGLKSVHKTFGQVFYFYGIPQGPYLMLPLIGPSNLRDTIGMATALVVSNYFLMNLLFGKKPTYLFTYQNVFSPFFYFHPKLSSLTWISLGNWIGLYFNKFVTAAPTLEVLSQGVIDKYLNFRTGYYQSLKNEEEKYDKLRKNGKLKRENVCDYDAMIGLPEECNDDPKTYSFSGGKD